MALPKEPRQKMINIMYLVLTAMLALNVSSSIINAFAVIDESLRGSNTVLATTTESIYNAFDELLKDPKTAEKAAIWKPKAEQVRTYSKEIYDMIEGYKNALTQESGLDKETGNYNREDVDAATRYFDVQGNGKILYAKLDEYKKNILSIDKDLAADISNKLPLKLQIPKAPEEGYPNGLNEVGKWIYGHFNMTPTIAALAMLSKFQNDIKNSENMAASFCIKQVGSVKLIFDKFEPLVGTSSTYMMPGEEMVVTAGLGAFNSKVTPVVTIDGRSIPVNANGVAESKFSAGGTGPKSMNVSVSFIDPNTGEQKSVTKKIDYVVGAPSGIAVSADKMNVLYIGVDNPVTITGGAGSERVSAQFTGGSITKVAGSNFKVKPSPGSDGTHEIKVLVDGKVTGTKQFRVKPLPDPVALVGENMMPGPVDASDFVDGGKRVRAQLKDSEFEAPFEVLGYTIFPVSPNVESAPIPISGSYWRQAQPVLDKLKPGSKVVISNVRVKGPDGRVRELYGSLTYILR